MSTGEDAVWDVVVVGAGPAGSAAALGVLAERPGARVLLLDRADFPRDKVCGDGVAPHALDVLAGAGVSGLLDDWPVAPRLRISFPGAAPVERVMARPSYVVPRAVLDARLVDAAVAWGAVLRRGRVRAVAPDAGGARVSGVDVDVRARVVVAADGAHSVLRRAVAPAQRPGTTAIAVRGYAPARPELDGVQVLAFAEHGHRPCYAWSFPIGDGRANVGYGELVPAPRRRGGDQARPTRAHLLARLEELLPGASIGATDVGGHPLPLSTGRGPVARGRLLLVGDAARLVNPVTGEGIYYATLSGVLAGRACANALAGGDPDRAGRLYSERLDAELGTHLHHTDLAARLVRSDRLLRAALAAADRDGAVFDALADVGLARGRLTRPVVRALASALVAEAVGGLRPSRRRP